MKISKTAQKILNQGFYCINYNQPRLVKAMKELEALGLVNIKEESNDYGHKWFIVRKK